MKMLPQELLERFSAFSACHVREQLAALEGRCARAELVANAIGESGRVSACRRTADRGILV